ncbi:hypothetical protein [Altericroceibacterium xinjiangense]|uniref:hypothetical protein n=1 Tax=Altericroceibacterium xinjiangense TaxID=762261 RepID=UPI000F7F1486|nr:hypothetical protein [Altericroceibacterium xinjiangense]
MMSVFRVTSAVLAIGLAACGTQEEQAAFEDGLINRPDALQYAVSASLDDEVMLIEPSERAISAAPDILGIGDTSLLDAAIKWCDTGGFAVVTASPHSLVIIVPSAGSWLWRSDDPAARNTAYLDCVRKHTNETFRATLHPNARGMVRAGNGAPLGLKD